MSLTILKIGGSVITEKQSEKPMLRRDVLDGIVRELKMGLPHSEQLILIHGVGSFGHPLARRYGLQTGTVGNLDKLKGSMETLLSCQNLNLEVMKALSETGLLVMPLHTSLAVEQQDNKIRTINIKLLLSLLKQGVIPVMYGSMVPDSRLGWSICSGDAVISAICQKLEVRRVLFATEVDGLYTDNPHTNKQAVRIEVIMAPEINNLNLKPSSKIDVTGGMLGKVSSMIKNNKLLTEELIVFNGIKKGYTAKALSNTLEICTKIKRG